MELVPPNVAVSGEVLGCPRVDQDRGLDLLDGAVLASSCAEQGLINHSARSDLLGRSLLMQLV